MHISVMEFSIEMGMDLFVGYHFNNVFIYYYTEPAWLSLANEWNIYA